MNTKRQTIWLVSMLSLMVVLSVYYLFTDNTETPELTSDELTANETVEIGVDEVTDGLIENQEIAAEEDAQTVTPSDEQVLTQLNSKLVSGDEYFAAQQIERNNALSKEYERLQNIVIDTEKDVETVTQAQNELQLIQDEQEIITNLEDVLSLDYENAIISKEANKWKVTVQSKKLEKSEAVSIIDQVMKELKARADQVVVAYIP